MPGFNPKRLVVARKRRRLSSKALADLIGMTSVTLSRLENSKNEPEDATIDALAAALQFPKEFFLSDDFEEPEAKAASFRSLTSMSAKERDAALASTTIAYLFTDWAALRFNLPTPQVPDHSFSGSPEGAAHAVREEWGLGQQPIANMIKLLESKGVRVFSLAENTKNVDAFSCWRDETPFVFLNTFKSTEHSRFDAAHELGHLILHRHGGPRQGREAEIDANRFASYFLMPTDDVAPRVRGIASVSDLVRAKVRWGVSVAALAYRLNKMGMLSEWHYRSLCIEIARCGYRTSEPQGLPPEKSVVWQKVLTALWSERITKDEIAANLNLPAGELENLLFGLTTASNEVPVISKPLLRIV